MVYNYYFEKLEVWQDARRLVKYIYDLTSTYPETEKYAICSQIQRAIVSVPSNIAEGMSRDSVKEKLRFLEVAYGSLMEVLCQLYLSVDLEYITQDQLETLRPCLNKTANELNALVRSLKKSKEKE